MDNGKIRGFTPQIVGKFGIFQDRKTGEYVVKDLTTDREIARVGTSTEAFAAAHNAIRS